MLNAAKQQLDHQLAPDAFNLAINDGPAAGQTVSYLHIYLISRDAGDCAEPRGGGRRVIPEKADYWKSDG